MTPDQQKIVDFISAKNKTKFYFNDFLEVFPEKGPREVKKILTAMVQSEVMEFWSSGSTTMYGIRGAGKQSRPKARDSDRRSSIPLHRPSSANLHCRQMT